MVNGEDHSDTIIILQHPPVYTLGTGSTEEFLKFDVNNAPFDIYRVERGGEVTYHGPGQVLTFRYILLRMSDAYAIVQHLFSSSSRPSYYLSLAIH